MASRTATTESNKRRRSMSADYPPIASKMPKTTNHLQINYLARQFSENLPLVSADDTLPSILRLIGDYDGVLHRHESIAGNLGACPLGPILVKRFERLFDSPPKVLKSHGKDGTTVTWLDVVEFAKNKPEQFNLEKTRNGVRVCQIYLKQTRVEISEEDYVLIASGMPQKMIPPQPISEDEEKELGALEILEKNLSQIIQLADQVSARARQLSHRLKNRKNAIVSRRESEAAAAAAASQSQSLGTWNDANGNNAPSQVSSAQSRNHSPQTGFVAVNSRPEPQQDYTAGGQFMFSNPNTDNITIINGTYVKGASPATRAELMKKFFTTADTRTRAEEEVRTATPRTNARRPRASEQPTDYAGPYAPVAIPSTPSSLLPNPRSHSNYERDDGGPFKIEMVSRMEDLKRGDRILPPCDRCRRLQMDCLKNLTACMGCTKKHAKCSWKEVTLEELRDTYPAISRKEQINRSLSSMSPRDSMNPQEQPPATREKSANTATPTPPTTSLPSSEPQTAARTSPPRRAASENNREQYQDSNDNDDAPDPLAQAIMDTVDQHRARAAVTKREKLEFVNSS